jgi:Radical SAM superfamily
VIPEEVVLEDVRRQVRAGATHITFGDPDFLNGPGHALRVVRAMHAEFPDLTFDITTKVEHILKRGSVLPELGRLGCLFLISAVESVSDRVLAILEKNHTRADMVEAIRLVREAGIAPRPTWVAFTPWTSLGDYLDMLAFIEENDLIDNVDPVQYTIRLLIPPNSYLLRRPEMKPHLGPLDQASFSYRWAHPDPRMDRLQKEVSKLVEKDVTDGVDPAATFYRVWSLAAGRKAGFGTPDLAPDRWRAPRLSEPWFC